MLLSTTDASLVSAIVCDCIGLSSSKVRESSHNLTMIIIALSLNIIACGGVSFLLSFHIYLWHLGLSSLEYLRMAEEKEKQASKVIVKNTGATALKDNGGGKSKKNKI